MALVAVVVVVWEGPIKVMGGPRPNDDVLVVVLEADLLVTTIRRLGDG
jgi:predicted Abi (CAAX) family protease